jgi:hypothetical protein
MCQKGVKAAPFGSFSLREVALLHSSEAEFSGPDRRFAAGIADTCSSLWL